MHVFLMAGESDNFGGDGKVLSFSAAVTSMNDGSRWEDVKYQGAWVIPHQ